MTDEIASAKSDKLIKVGSKEVSVKIAVRPKERTFLSNLFYGLKSLIIGLKTTFYYFARPKTCITQQYPENKKTLKMCDRYRAQLQLKYDEQGFHNCTGCKICDQNCPNKSIKIISKKGLSGKQEIDSYIWNMDTCIFCNLCVQVCPFDALEMASNFESAVFDRKSLIYQLNRYAGPHKKFLEKLENIEDKQKMINDKRGPYSANVPLSDIK